jgi:outer membrane protein assembly factor BamD (BamD/ComL family)
MKSLSLLFTLIILNNANASNLDFIDGLFSVTKPGEILNCDSEDVKEHRKYNYKNPPKNYFNADHWFKEIAKAEKRKDYCRASQGYFHLYNIIPFKQYHELEIQKKVIESLYKGKYFLELQWQVRNYREAYGDNEEVEIMQVKSYWPYVEYIKEKNRCINPTGYYLDSKTGKELNIVKEAHISINVFLKNFPNSKYTAELEEKRKYVKNTNAFKLVCEAKSATNALIRVKEVKIYHYLSIYKRLAQVVANYQESDVIEEAIYLLIDTSVKIQTLAKLPIANNDTDQNHPYNSMYEEDWQVRIDGLMNILNENFPDSEWTVKANELFN